MSPASAICPHCRRTIHHAGALHRCEVPAPPEPGSSIGTGIAIAVLAFAVGSLIGWAIYRAVVST